MKIPLQPHLEDGRSITPALGLLSGEAGGVAVKRPELAWPLPGEAGAADWPAQVDAVDTDGPSYYGLPLVKEPVWAAPIPFYFWIGGAAGAAAVWSQALRRFGGAKLARLARRAAWLAAFGDQVGTACLIYDLGRPGRFLNMLRVLRPSSPMSIGSWVLAASTACNTAALWGTRRDLLGRLARGAGALGGLLGMPLAGYTAVLLSNSAVPVWQAGRRSLPLLFMCSSIGTAGSLLAFVARGAAERRAAHRFALAGQLGELGTTLALHREVGVVSRVARPLRSGRSGRLLTAATTLTAASVVVSLLPGQGQRRSAALLGALGSLVLRYGLLAAGKASARDPWASFAQQRPPAALRARHVPVPASTLCPAPPSTKAR